MLILLIIVAVVLSIALGFHIEYIREQYRQYKIEKTAINEGYIFLNGFPYRLTYISLWDKNKDEIWSKVMGMCFESEIVVDKTKGE